MSIQNLNLTKTRDKTGQRYIADDFVMLFSSITQITLRITN